MLLGSRLHKVLHGHLEEGKHSLVPRFVFHALYETIHTFFASGEFHGTVLVPEFILLHGRIRLHPQRGSSPEQFFLNGLKGVVGLARGADGNRLPQHIHQGEFHNHIIGRKHPFAIVQLRILLFHP